MFVFVSDYKRILNGDLDDEILKSRSLIISDHMGGFDVGLYNSLLNYLEILNFKGIIETEYIITDELRNRYKKLKLQFSLYNSTHFQILDQLIDYNIHPEIKYKNFVCSFNGSPHVSRQLLTSMMEKFDIFDSNYSSKNFKNTYNQINGQLENLGLSSTQKRMYGKFLSDNDKFLNTLYSFDYTRYDHANNISTLETKITESFVHIVSETMSTSYYPFVTEKFLYSIVTRGLFVSYAQPNWHFFLEKYYGFKKYNKIFDYSFDSIQNPIERIIKMMEMILKFSKLSIHDWNDLYLMEQDTIEYNYDHYFSKRYMEHLKKYEN